MVTHLVMTVLGDDRPGIVRSISDQVAAAGGNWLESRMAHLAGKFAGIVLVAVHEPQTERLSRRAALARHRGPPRPRRAGRRRGFAARRPRARARADRPGPAGHRARGVAGARRARRGDRGARDRGRERILVGREPVQGERPVERAPHGVDGVAPSRAPQGVERSRGRPPSGGTGGAGVSAPGRPKREPRAPFARVVQ